MTVRHHLRQLHDRAFLALDLRPSAADLERATAFDKVNYACGRRCLPSWLNIDIRPASRIPAEARASYIKLSLTRPHPFRDGTFRFGYSEDFLEHLSQADALVFLAEAFRTLAPGGVLRVSTPGLRGVLRRHLRSSDFAGAETARAEAYTPFGHVHFFSEESLEAIARHIGFRDVAFRNFGESPHRELRARETRAEQDDLNIIAELTR